MLEYEAEGRRRQRATAKQREGERQARVAAAAKARLVSSLVKNAAMYLREGDFVGARAAVEAGLAEDDTHEGVRRLAVAINTRAPPSILRLDTPWRGGLGTLSPDSSPLSVRRAASPQVRINPIVTFEKRLLTMIGNLV
jgi:hypothetical protein